MRRGKCTQDDPRRICKINCLAFLRILKDSGIEANLDSNKIDTQNHHFPKSMGRYLKLRGYPTLPWVSPRLP